MQKRAMNSNQTYLIRRLLVIVAPLVMVIVSLLIWRCANPADKVPETYPDSLAQRSFGMISAPPQVLTAQNDSTMAKATRKPRNIIKGHYLLIVKAHHYLAHYMDGKLQHSYPIAIGQGMGDKSSTKEMMTPEGHFHANLIKDASLWTYDFQDGKGPIQGAYGPWFISIVTDRKGTFSREGWSGIGIHGTHDESSIGKNLTHGCIRMRNKDLIELKTRLEESIGKKITIPVDILPKL